MSENLVNFSLYDNDGRVYYKLVTQQEAKKLEYDSARCYRTIQGLKSQGQGSRGQLDHSGFRDPMSSQAGAGCKPKVRKVKWKEAEIDTLLTALRPYRKTLRKKQVSIEFWNKMSLLLKRQQIQYSGEQLRDKIRLLKQSKNPGSWARSMSFLFESPLDDNEPEPKWVDIVDEMFDVSQGNATKRLDATSNSADFHEPNEADGDADCISLHAHDTMLQDTMSTSTAHETLQVLRVVQPPNELQQQSLVAVENEDKNGDAYYIYAHDTMQQNTTSTSRAHEMQQLKAPNELQQKSTIPPENEDHGLHIPSGLVDSSMQGMSLSETIFNRNVEINSTPQKSQVGAWYHSTWRSPSAKCSKSSSDIRGGTPGSTPRKRKTITQAEIMWPKDVTLKFVEECVKRKREVQDGASLRVWKELSESVPYDWKTCKNKFHAMKEFFCKSLLKCKGTFGGIKWPYYDMFCAIHDVPNDICIVLEDGLIDEEASGPHAASSGGKKIWFDGAIELLLSLYKERRDKFRSTKSGVRHSQLYMEISKEMQDFQIDVSAKQCKLQIADLFETFRKEFDKENGTGRPPSKWPWYKAFMTMEEGNPNLQAPYAFTIGTAAGHHLYTVQGETSQTRQSNTRSRNEKTVQEKQGKISDKSSKKPVFKTWLQDMQEQQLEAKRELNLEVRLLREGQDKRSDARMAALNNINETLKLIGESIASQKNSVGQ